VDGLNLPNIVFDFRDVVGQCFFPGRISTFKSGHRSGSDFQFLNDQEKKETTDQVENENRPGEGNQKKLFPIGILHNGIRKQSRQCKNEICKDQFDQV
jgi:hypothetical protein